MKLICIEALYLITKLQNLKAIHNTKPVKERPIVVVSNYKITKSESYSQQPDPFKPKYTRCI